MIKSEAAGALRSTEAVITPPSSTSAAGSTSLSVGWSLSMAVNKAAAAGYPSASAVTVTLTSSSNTPSSVADALNLCECWPAGIVTSAGRFS